MMVSTCPHCGKTNEMDEALEGTGVHCIACGQPFVLTANGPSEESSNSEADEENASPASVPVAGPVEPALGSGGVSVPSQLPRGAAAWGCVLFAIVLVAVIFLLFMIMADKRRDDQQRKREQDRKEKVEKRQEEVEEAVREASGGN